MVQGFCVEIFRPEYQLLRVEKFRADERQNEAFQGHAVVGKKAAEGEGERSQDADPADFSCSNDIPQAEVHSHGHHDGQQGEQELPQGQAEEQAFLVVPDFFVDTNFYDLSLLSLWGSFFLLYFPQILFHALRVKLPQFLHVKRNFRISAPPGVASIRAERPKLIFQNKV